MPEENSYLIDCFSSTSNPSVLAGSGQGGMTDKCHEHNEKSITTKRTYEYNDNWELTRCTEKSDGNKTVVHNYEYDKVGNRTVYERLENGVTKERYKYDGDGNLVRE